MENSIKAIDELQERISRMKLASKYQIALQTEVLALQKQVPQKPRSGRNKSSSCIGRGRTNELNEYRIY